MIKNFIISLLAIVLIVGGWFFIGQNEKLEEAGEMNAYFLDYYHQEIATFSEQVLYAIEDEIKNIGKTENAGLKDTIKWLTARHKTMLRDSGFQISPSIAQSYTDSIKAIYKKVAFTGDSLWNTDWEVPVSHDRIKLDIMQYELALLKILNGRLNVHLCLWGGYKYEPFFHVEQDTILVQMRDTLAVRLGLEWLSWQHYTVDFSLVPFFEWKASKGWIETKEYYKYWLMPIDSTLNEEYISVVFEGKVWKATGGYEYYPPFTKVIRVVP